MTTTIEITSSNTVVEASAPDTVIEITSESSSIEVSPTPITPLASFISVEPYNTITAENVQQALEQLADQSFRGSSSPSGSNVEEGDVWYNTVTEQYNVYREVSAGTFEWVPIILGAPGGTSDLLDGGAF